MKTLLIAINAKYIHSNLAVYSLKASAGQWKDEVEIAEYTINHLREDILADIYRRKPDVAAISCYIWNMEYVQSLLKDLKKFLQTKSVQVTLLRFRVSLILISVKRFVTLTIPKHFRS